MGYHDYIDVWKPKLNEVLRCEMQPNNSKDKYAVAVKKRRKVVGHLPKGENGKFTKFIFYFLRASNGNSCSATITGKPFNAGKNKGMQVPCHLTLIGTEPMITRLRKVLLK